MTAYPLLTLQGFLLGAGLIIAIGAQNAYVLRQGLSKRHVLPLVLLCAFSDALLVTVGAAGFGSLVAANPVLVTAVGVGGAMFLFGYAGLAFARAARPQGLAAVGVQEPSLARVLTTGAAFTFLNPHVYLDTVVLAGGLAGRFPPEQRVWFTAGVILDSFVWFFALGYGARVLTPVFARPTAWRLLDLLIGCVMIGLGLKLLAEVVTASGGPLPAPAGV
ncbi:MAG: amino acid transporter [Azospirillum sp.]|nr:amino acid transporter [Azospirillum sp.]